MAAGAGHELLDQQTAQADPRWELVQRVAASPSFQKSRRLRDFLLFVCERELTSPENIVREHEIGTLVFGMPANFIAGNDSLVRVHASRLRKRLEHYFATDGAAEPIVIEIPKHTYMPLFRQRQGAALAPAPAPEPPAAAVEAVRPVEPATPVVAVPPPTRQRPRRMGLVFGALALVLLGVVAWLLVENRGLRRRLHAGLDPRPTVDRLWTQMFGNGRSAYIVLADSNLTLIQDVMRRQLSPMEYEQKAFAFPPEKRPEHPDWADLSNRIMHRQFTSIADADLARRIGLLNAVHGIPTDVILARNAGPQHFKSHNAVLAGPRRANPWLELFEDRLNFRNTFDEAKRLASFENVAPMPGEQASYVVKWNQLGYCRVAFLPNLDRTGSVLLLSGTEMGSTQAGVEFVTSEHWARKLDTTLGGQRPFPYFEVLLRVELMVSLAPRFEMIAHRVIAN